MIETREKNIDGAVYTVTQLPARRAIRLKARLIKLFGPVAATFFIASEGISEDQKKLDLVKCVESLGNHIDENALESVIIELLIGVRKNNIELTPAIIDMEFAGDMATLYQVVWFVIEVNFSNFFLMFGIGSQCTQELPIPKDSMKKSFMRN
jgi:hypothetical protein